MSGLALYVAILLVSVFVSALSQVMLKISATRTHKDTLHEYANPLVVGAYTLFVLSSLLTVYAYKEVPLSMGPVLESTSYVYITVFGILIFHEKITRTKLIALALIIGGICCFSFFG